VRRRCRTTARRGDRACERAGVSCRCGPSKELKAVSGCALHPAGCLPLPLHTRLSGASGARHSLRPLIGEGGTIAGLCLAVIARSEATKQSTLSYCSPMDCFASLAMTASDTLQPSSPRKQGTQYSRDASDEIDKPRRTGYSAFAEYDDRHWSALVHTLSRRPRHRVSPSASPMTGSGGDPVFQRRQR
jgi:hypothetical protein